jgi:hypothetical protein
MTKTKPLPTWCGPIAVKLLTGKNIKDQEMRSVEVLCHIEKKLGEGKIIVGKGKTVREFAKGIRIGLVFAKGHVMVVLNGELFNACSWYDEPVTWAATW